MIDMLPRAFGQRALPYFRNGEVKCAYCDFNGSLYSGNSALVHSKIKGASFRFVDSVDGPKLGVCGRYHCRQMFRKEQSVAEQVELAKL